MKVRHLMVTLLAIGGLPGCGSPATRAARADSVRLAERAARLDSAMAHPDDLAPEKPVALWKLPESLKELSGLALMRDGRLLTHGDEKGRVFEIDYRRGVITKQFTIGSPMVHGDFESITVVRDSILLLTSDGRIFRFRDGADKGTVPFTTTDTRLGARCEFEGMTFDSTANALVLACKTVHDQSLKGSLVLFVVPLGGDSTGAVAAPTMVQLSLADIPEAAEWGGFHPSDITIDPLNGNYLLIAGIEQAMVEVTPKGELVFARALPKGHEQPEGVAITKDHLLIISDEAKKGPARITIYPWQR